MEPPRALATPSRGFTLVEMLVVLSIIAIVTTIALFGQSNFNRSVLLTDTAYTVALSLREMQSLGLSSRAFGSIRNAAYGGRFAPANASSYILFADTGGASPLVNCPADASLAATHPEKKPGNCRYDAGTDGIVQTYSFSGRFALTSVCGTRTANGVRYCSDSSGLTAVDVAFLRSNTTDTIMTGVLNGVSTPLSKAEIYIRSTNGAGTRGICISQVGQVSVAVAACP